MTFITGNITKSGNQESLVKHSTFAANSDDDALRLLRNQKCNPLAIGQTVISSFENAA